MLLIHLPAKIRDAETPKPFPQYKLQLETPSEGDKITFPQILQHELTGYSSLTPGIYLQILAELQLLGCCLACSGFEEPPALDKVLQFLF